MLVKIMGLLLFLAGFAGIIIATLDVLDIIKNITPIEGFWLYLGGVILCVLGYIMARTRGEPPEIDQGRSEDGTASF